jgi:murein DD-endopeptidase MepM/ murein hydrolase activator NlpD
VSLLLRAAGVTAAAGLVWTAAASQAAEEAKLPVDLVVRDAVMTQPFGCSTLELEPFDPYCPSHHFHSGVDLAAPQGTPVISATAGSARVGYDDKGAGLFVDVAFDSHVRILYCHLLRVAEIHDGRVTAGEQIGEVGASGIATGPHLHLEVDVDGRAVDPGRWLESP